MVASIAKMESMRVAENFGVEMMPDVFGVEMIPDVLGVEMIPDVLGVEMIPVPANALEAIAAVKSDAQRIV